MRALAAPRVAASGLDVRMLGLPGEALPLPDRSVDTVVVTYTLCTIPDAAAALDQMRRVLRLCCALTGNCCSANMAPRPMPACGAGRIA